MGQGNEIPPKEEVDVNAKEPKELGSNKPDYETLTVSVKITEDDEGSNGPTEIQVSKK